ncbi:hypothetical protein PV04_00538 [Phialophora macrospora]|uniref:Uncharacterized protein n=1 Tax=Phialophora macrospora TaxID=1851006 RepID=A0A0D2FV40_9EURO|nr:hypothetical protein PV04_00538 [Phialophora macrospora]
MANTIGLISVRWQLTFFTMDLSHLLLASFPLSKVGKQRHCLRKALSCRGGSTNDFVDNCARSDFYPPCLRHLVSLVGFFAQANTYLNIIQRTALDGRFLVGEMGLWIRCSQVFALPLMAACNMAE